MPAKRGTFELITYNGAAAYGQRIAAQMSNPNYNTNIITNVAQKVYGAVRSYVGSLLSGR